jgi:enoyl-[acyl-carrier protein] reductase I
MSNGLLKGKKGIIFGALDPNSIAWKVAMRAHEEGAQFTLTNAPVAMRLGAINELAQATGSQVIPADATVNEDLEKLFTSSMEILGGKVDFVLHSIGMSPNVRKSIPYTETNYDFYHKTLDISAMSLHRVLRTAMKLDAINEWGSVVALTYIAAQRSFGYHYGKAKKVRVNTISQSPTRTTAGSGVKGFDGFFTFADRMSPLGNASAESCADYCISMFSDLTRMVTMQNLFHDGGYSFTGVSQDIMDGIKE